MITIEITDKISHSSEEAHLISISRVHEQLSESIGEYVRWGIYPIVSWGDGWMISCGAPQENQKYWLTIDDDVLATGYILKHG